MMKKILFKIKTILSVLWIKLFIYRSKLKYYILSTNKIHGVYNSSSPLLSLGKGYIFIDGASIGVWRSPYFFNSYTYLDARDKNSKIIIGKNVWINNNAFICADKTSITIGDNCLIGTSFSCVDSDFHSLNSNSRLSGSYECKPVKIGENVFIGNNVIILKGVTIGENCVIGAGSVVTKSFPANVMIAGNPARVIRKL